MIRQILLLLCCFWIVCPGVAAQAADSFDGLTFVTPKGWQKDVKPSAIQLGTEGAKGECLITIFKSVRGSGDSKANFQASWETLVRDTVKPTGKPESQPSTTENGWVAESGFAPYEIDGKKGLALLLSMTGTGKVVNILVLTNTDAYQTEIDGFLKSVTLPKVQPAKPDTAKADAVSAPRKSGYKFNTTNFDDGWTAVEQSDWVRVTKGKTVVLVHYPDPNADAYHSVLKEGLANAWNVLVAPRYANVHGFELKPIQSWESIDFAEADAEERSTGKPVHVVLFKKHFSKGNGRYLEFVTESKRDFEAEFGAYHNTEFHWDKLVDMQGRNKFAVGSSDLVGKWSTHDYASLSYYYADSGGLAGTTATSTADEFGFSKGGTYQSDHSGASGMVGNMKFSRQVYKGAFSATDWNLTLTNRFQGKTEKYDCRFEAVKGGRILILTDRLNFVSSLVKQ